MHRVVPKILNGTRHLVISESFCCDPNQNVSIFLPITPEKSVELRLEFEFDEDSSIRRVDISKTDDILIIKLNNFLNSLGTSLTNPLELTIGKDRFSLQMYGSSTNRDMLCLTISLFKEAS